jgi:hypothetical protein
MRRLNGTPQSPTVARAEMRQQPQAHRTDPRSGGGRRQIMDTSGDGSLSCSEFCTSIKRLVRRPRPPGTPRHRPSRAHAERPPSRPTRTRPRPRRSPRACRACTGGAAARVCKEPRAGWGRSGPGAESPSRRPSRPIRCRRDAPRGPWRAAAPRFAGPALPSKHAHRRQQPPPLLTAVGGRTTGSTCPSRTLSTSRATASSATPTARSASASSRPLCAARCCLCSSGCPFPAGAMRASDCSCAIGRYLLALELPPNVRTLFACVGTELKLQRHFLCIAACTAVPRLAQSPRSDSRRLPPCVRAADQLHPDEADGLLQLPHHGRRGAHPHRHAQDDSVGGETDPRLATGPHPVAELLPPARQHECTSILPI